MDDLTPAELGRLLNVNEVAEYLGISTSTLYAWRSQGKGPRAIKAGKHLRYRRSELERWLDSNLEDTVGDHGAGAGDEPAAAAAGESSPDRANLAA